jgi:hypothetical protein
MSHRSAKVPHPARPAYHVGLALVGMSALLAVFLVHGALHHGREIIARIAASTSALHLAGAEH